MDVIWETEKLKVDIIPLTEMVRIKSLPLGDDILVSPDELTAFARHWLELKNYFVVDPTDADEFLIYCKNQLNIHGYDVAKCKPEIKACPYCGGSCFVIDVNDGYQVLCSDCEYKSRILYYSGLLKDGVKLEIIRLHNLIARKGE